MLLYRISEVKPMAEMNEQEQQSKEPIRSDMIVRDVILAHPDAAEVLMRVGMGCISCPAALMENLAMPAWYMVWMVRRSSSI